ncbi:conserved protein of unknown function [Modestobacter italicus]|uniref:DUF4333 domain-containing protein n=1 Tax=Modestobacter italicus (strain DSM 44449 / CECT 9708 / BC 501) TaxID=2732864 RepID=I4F1H8_MODI5|nr:hypothetical protein [Modestobacter marinus]CCH89491.1 conserved protein of unknown function [Modestobacter marinus]
MSTDGTTPTDPQTPSAQPAGATTFEPGAAAPSVSEGTLGNVPETDTEPGWVARHTATLITLMVAVVVAAVAIAGVMLYKDRIDDRNSDTEAAVAKNVASQGASVETVECDGDTCAAVINGQAYTVLVQEDAQGERHFGVSAYAGN